MPTIKKIYKGNVEYTMPQGPIGPQGPQGDSVLVGEGDLPLAHVTGEDNTKAMSQKGVTDTTVYEEVSVDFASISVISKGYYIDSSGNWQNNTNMRNTCSLYATTPGTVFRVTAQEGTTCSVEFLTSDSHSAGASASLAGSMIGFQSGSRLVTAPAGTAWMYIRKKVTDVDRSPYSIEKLTTIKQKVSDVATATSNQATQIGALQDAAQDAAIYEQTVINVSNLSLISKGYYILETNGKWYNNTSNVNTACLYPTSPGTVFKVVANNSSDMGCDVEFLTSNSHASGKVANFATDGMIGFATGTRYLTAPAGTAWLYIRIRRNQSSPADVSPSSVTEVKYMKTAVKDALESSGNISTSVGSEKSLVRQANYGGSYNSQPVTTLGLMHFSDLHGDEYAAKALLKHADTYSSYIDDVLCTGDVVNYYISGSSTYPNGTEWWQGTGLPDITLFTQGNHDGYSSSMVTADYDNDPWSSNGKAWDFQTYFEPYIGNLGYVMPEGYDDLASDYYQSCFWHKDYSDAKVRLIGLDCIHRFDGVVDPTTGAITSPGVFHTDSGNEQELWLIDRLNECLDGSGDSAEGFHVIFCSHFPLDDYSGDNMTWDDATHKWVCNNNEGGGRLMDHKTADVVNFHNYYSTSLSNDAKFSFRSRTYNASAGSSKWTQYSKDSTNNIANIIEAWVLRGGTPVAFLCGHYHYDYMFYPANATDILVVAINQAGGVRPNNVGDKSDVNYGREVANYYAVDTAHHLFKIVRLGMKDNRQLIPTTFLTYNYLSKKVISEG